jgi:hypothetical protein
MPAFRRGQRGLTGNLVGAPAADRMSIGTRFKRRHRRAKTHGPGMETTRTESTSVRRIEVMQNLPPGSPLLN